MTRNTKSTMNSRPNTAYHNDENETVSMKVQGGVSRHDITFPIVRMAEEKNTSPKKVLWKDRDGAKYTTNHIPLKPAHSRTGASLVRKGAVTGAAMIGLSVVLGPLGLVVGAAGAAGSAAGVAATQQLKRKEDRKAHQAKLDLARAPPCQSPPSRSFPVRD